MPGSNPSSRPVRHRDTDDNLATHVWQPGGCDVAERSLLRYRVDLQYLVFRQHPTDLDREEVENRRAGASVPVDR